MTDEIGTSLWSSTQAEESDYSLSEEEFSDQEIISNEIDIISEEESHDESDLKDFLDVTRATLYMYIYYFIYYYH